VVALIDGRKPPRETMPRLSLVVRESTRAVSAIDADTASASKSRPARRALRVT
jgi:hypothetical protein